MPMASPMAFAAASLSPVSMTVRNPRLVQRGDRGLRFGPGFVGEAYAPGQLAAGHDEGERSAGAELLRRARQSRRCPRRGSSPAARCRRQRFLRRRCR